MTITTQTGGGIGHHDIDADDGFYYNDSAMSSVSLFDSSEISKYESVTGFKPIPNSYKQVRRYPGCSLSPSIGDTLLTSSHTLRTSSSTYSADYDALVLTQMKSQMCYLQFFEEPTITSTSFMVSSTVSDEYATAATNVVTFAPGTNAADVSTLENRQISTKISVDIGAYTLEAM